MESHAFWNSFKNRQRSVDCDVTRTPGHDHLSPRSQRRLDRLNSHHGHESPRLPDIVFPEMGCRRERSDFSPAERLEKGLWIHLAVDRGEFEMPLVGARQFPDNLNRPVEVWSAAGMSCRADNDRYASPQSLA